MNICLKHRRSLNRSGSCGPIHLPGHHDVSGAESRASFSAECLKGANDFETIGSWEKAGLTMDKQDPHELGDDANERAPEWPIGPDAIKIESVAMEKRAG